MRVEETAAKYSLVNMNKVFLLSVSNNVRFFSIEFRVIDMNREKYVAYNTQTYNFRVIVTLWMEMTPFQAQTPISPRHSTQISHKTTKLESHSLTARDLRIQEARSRIW